MITELHHGSGLVCVRATWGSCTSGLGHCIVSLNYTAPQPCTACLRWIHHCIGCVDSPECLQAPPLHRPSVLYLYPAPVLPTVSLQLSSVLSDITLELGLWTLLGFGHSS